MKIHRNSVFVFFDLTLGEFRLQVIVIGVVDGLFMIVFADERGIIAPRVMPTKVASQGHVNVSILPA